MVKLVELVELGLKPYTNLCRASKVCRASPLGESSCALTSDRLYNPSEALNKFEEVPSLRASNHPVVKFQVNSKELGALTSVKW